MCDEKKMHTQRKTGDGGTEKKNVQQCKQTTSNWIITCTNKLDDSKLSTQIEFRLSDQPKLASQPSGDIVYMSIHDFVNLFILTHFNSGLTTLFISLCSYRCCCCYYFVFLIIFGRHKQLHTCMCASIYVSIGRKTVLFIRLRLAVNHSNNATKTYILNRCQRHRIDIDTKCTQTTESIAIAAFLGCIFLQKQKIAATARKHAVYCYKNRVTI